MRRSNEQTISEVISELFEQKKFKGKLAETNIIGHWEELVGTLIARQTEKIYFSRGKLYLQITSPALRQELHYSRSKIIQIINEFAKQELITDVVVR